MGKFSRLYIETQKSPHKKQTYGGKDPENLLYPLRSGEDEKPDFTLPRYISPNTFKALSNIATMSFV